jgi:transcriptional regulator with XRE-family HTH domain
MTPQAFRRWYESRNLTQRQVAGLLGIRQRRVSDMARGKVPVSRQTERQLQLCEVWETEKRGDLMRLRRLLDGVSMIEGDTPPYMRPAHGTAGTDSWNNRDQ